MVVSSQVLGGCLVKAGDIVKFHSSIGRISAFREMVGKLALFLGDRPIHRDDGVTVDNFEIHIFGEDTPRLCDGAIKSWLSVESASR